MRFAWIEIYLKWKSNEERKNDVSETKTITKYWNENFEAGFSR